MENLEIYLAMVWIKVWEVTCMDGSNLSFSCRGILGKCFNLLCPNAFINKIDIIEVPVQIFEGGWDLTRMNNNPWGLGVTKGRGTDEDEK